MIIDEAQNCSLKELTTVLTRLGEGAFALFWLIRCKQLTWGEEWFY